MYIDTGKLSSVLAADLVASGWNGYLQPYPGQPVRQFAMSALAKSSIKKYLPGTLDTSPAGDLAALNLFLEINERCRTWSFQSQLRNEAEEIALGEAKKLLYNFFYPIKQGESDVGPTLPPDFRLNSGEIWKSTGCGPGAAVGTRGTNFYFKFATSELTATDQSLFFLYEQMIRSYPTWKACEDFRQTRKGRQIIAGSRLSFVPKTSKISRCICTEPILNMFFQKGIQGSLERGLKEVIGIDFSNQPDENSLLARIGSETGRFGTIDLQSASDSMSMALVKEFFPRRVFDLLSRFRSPKTVLPDGRTIDLHMVSSMGNAFTFPLQTLFFSAIVLGAYRVLGIKPKHFRGRFGGESNFAVFGDDIIVEREAFNLVSRLLSISGFTVNQDKSFNEGLFRESCGSDYMSGHNVRGVFIQSLNDANDLYSAINRFNRWSARWQVPLPITVGFLRKKCRFLPIPYDEDDSFGIKVPVAMLREPLIRHPDTGGIIYRYSKIDNEKFSLTKVDERKKARLGYFENLDGLLLSFLAGYIRKGSIGMRTMRRRSHIRVRYSSRWDYIVPDTDESSCYSERWKLLTQRNL
jgi:hypothetical protein